MSTPTPGLPAEVAKVPEVKSGERQYRLTYRKSRMLDHVNFVYNGTFEEAINEGRNYCKELNLAFVNVELYFHDLRELLHFKKRRLEEEYS